MAAATAIPTMTATNVRRIKVMNPAAKTASGRCQAVGLKCGASWSRTSDLTLIRGAL